MLRCGGARVVYEMNKTKQNKTEQSTGVVAGGMVKDVNEKNETAYRDVEEGWVPMLPRYVVPRLLWLPAS